ncbi:MAG TPA: PEP-CTERM sorting domain-containing protein [Acidobacteriaceae bacterium]|nr:PEP-CTERM sorting domain-containing protein [Acidobacteriaceae bacterium]
MKKRLQLILVGSLLLPCSTGVLLASNAHCRSWVAQAATQSAEKVVAKKRHYSKKVLAVWAAWRAKHPNAKPVGSKPRRRPASFTSPQVRDVLGFYCDVAAETVDEAIATIVQPVANATAPAPPDVAVDATDAPGPFTLLADGPQPPDDSVPGGPPMSSGPTGYGYPPTTGMPFPGVPPAGSPPSGLPPLGWPTTGNPPTTGSSVPPPPVAVTPEPNSLLLLGTGIASAAGLLRQRKLLL